MTYLKPAVLKLSIFFAILIGVYLAFSVYIVSRSLSVGLIISPSLKNYHETGQKKTGQYVIGIISPSRRGEMQQAIMVQEAAEKIDQLSYVYSANDLDMELFIPAKYINEMIIRYLDYKYKTDFHLVMSFHVNFSLKEPNIMYISVPKGYLLDGRLEKFPTVANYTKFLDINLINGNEEMMKEILNPSVPYMKSVVSSQMERSEVSTSSLTERSEDRGYLEETPYIPGKATLSRDDAGGERNTHAKIQSAYAMVGVPASVYQTSNRQNLVFFGSIWGRKTDGFYKALNMLSSKDYMYFIKNPLVILSLNSPQKFTEQASGPEGLEKVLNKYGMALCVHSKYHNAAGIPSSRIFEIISSGAIAISDRNPFVVKYFGDNVLYFDPKLPAETIVKQIDGHVQWVRSNPLIAEEMAKKAHQVIQDNFTTEKFVEDAVKFYCKLQENQDL